MTGKFSLQKKRAVNRFKSSIKVGDIDEDIVPLCELINAHPDYYTTSSCAGRIVLFQDKGGKLKSEFLAKWHRKVTAKEVIGLLKPCNDVLWYRVEPPIIHVVCSTLKAADRLLGASLSTGFKRTGIQSINPEKYVVEVLSTERFDAPIMVDCKQVVSNEYITILVEESNKKITQSQKKLARLEKAFTQL